MKDLRISLSRSYGVLLQHEVRSYAARAPPAPDSHHSHESHAQAIHHLARVVHTCVGHIARTQQVRRHHGPRRRIAAPNRDRRRKINPELAIARGVLVVVDQAEAGLPRLQHIAHLLPGAHTHRRPVDRAGARVRRPVRVRVAGTDERGQVALVAVCEGGEAGQDDGEQGAQGVALEVGVPEGREQVRRVPARRRGILHVVDLAGVGVG